MLDELFPVQFIEGINEFSHADEHQHISVREWSGVALRYQPDRTYTLTKVSVYLAKEGTPSNTDYRISLLLDNDGPSEIPVSSGSWGNEPYDSWHWQNITISPVVVFADTPYWFAIAWSSIKANILLPLTDGIAVDTKFRARDMSAWRKWEAFESTTPMLRMYGRVVSVTR